MEVLRKFGVHELIVETAEPCGIALDERAIRVVGRDGQVNKKALLRYLSSGDQYIPLTLAWEVLDSCNLACPFCYIVGHSNNKAIRFAGVRDHVSELVDAGVLFCTLTGGEVTIHPDFVEIYRFLKMRGVVVEVFTNGYAIDDAQIDLFRELPPSEIEISLYTLDDRRLTEVYGFRRPGGASRVLQNVLRLRDAGVNVICKTFLTTVTAADIESIVAWCEHHGLEHYSSREVAPGYDGADLSGYAVSSGGSQPIANSPVCLPCGTKNYGSAIDSAFRLYPCPSIRLPDCRFDLRELGVAESIGQMKDFMRRFQDVRIEGAGCASCIAYASPVRDAQGALVGFAQP